MISVCIPVYNTEKYLNECILSVLNQSYSDFEIILVDDGSKDRSYSICQYFSNLDHRIKCFTKKNEGQLATRLFAFSKAKGDIIVCLDSDDYLDENALETIINYFFRFDCDCVYFGWRRFFENHVVKLNQICKNVELYENPRLKYKKIFGNSNFNSMCLKAFKSCVLSDVDYSAYGELRMAEDLIQTVGIIKRSKKIILIPEIIYNYRINPESATQNVSKKNLDINDLSRNYVYLFLKQENVFSDKDWREYGIYCNDLFFQNLTKIACLTDSIQERRFLLNEKKKSDYYNHFIKFYNPSKISRCFCMYLFKKGFLLEIIIISKLFDFLFAVRNLIKGKK